MWWFRRENDFLFKVKFVILGCHGCIRVRDLGKSDHLRFILSKMGKSLQNLMDAYV